MFILYVNYFSKSNLRYFTPPLITVHVPLTKNEKRPPSSFSYERKSATLFSVILFNIHLIRQRHNASGNSQSGTSKAGTTGPLMNPFLIEAPMSLQKKYPDHFCLCLIILLGAVLLLPATALSTMQPQKQLEKETTININQKVLVVSGRMSLNLLHGESGEYVYEPSRNHKLSELQWQIEDVYMLGLGGSISPLAWLKLNADLWFKLNKGSGNMDDFDWYIENFQYTDWSHHENVDLTRGVMFDINAEMTFYEYMANRFYGIVGFKYDTWEWEAFGGSYTYSTFALYDTVGSFADDEKVISYEQNYYAPYIGLGFSSDLSETPLTFSGRVIYSPFVSGDDKDQHHLRDLVFEEEYDSGTLFSCDLTGSYHFTSNITMTLAYHFQLYDEMRGSTTITDNVTGQKTFFSGDVAGMDHSSHMFSLGVEYMF